jgi:tetratricopeptide (TPR) repeat protein
LSVREIADRLDRRFSLLTGGQRTALLRHQTLRAAIEWSFDLLSEKEQVLFRRLSIFAGSFSLEDAETICVGPEITRDEVLTLVGRLVAKSLLNVEPVHQDSKISTRYRFLDTIHSFGQLKLDEAGETGWMSARHANYYAHMAETAEPVFFLQDQVHWIKLLQAEYDNIRAVIEWSSETDQAESALRVVASILWFWWLNGFVREGRDLALKALDLPSAMDFRELRARALNTAGFMQCLLGETASAKQLLEEALSILRTSDDEVHLAWSLQFLGLVFAYENEFSLADAADQESRVIIDRIKRGNTNSLFFLLGDIDLLKGDFSRANEVYEENVEILRETRSKSALAYPVRRLGYLALEQNDFQKAHSYFQESLTLNHEVGDMPGVTACLLSMAVLATKLGKPILAACLYGAVESRLDQLLMNLLITDQAELRRIKNELAVTLDEATFTDAFTEGWEMSEEQAIKLAEGI